MRSDGIDLLPREPEMAAPTHRSAGAWLVVLLALACVLAMAAVLEGLHRRDLRKWLQAPLGGFDRQVLRELSNAESWTGVGAFTRSADMYERIGARHPESDLAAYAYYRASVALRFGGQEDEHSLELGRKAVEVAMPNSPRFVALFTRLARDYELGGELDKGMAVREAGVRRAGNTKQKGSLVAGLMYRLREVEGPGAALEAYHRYCGSDPALRQHQSVLHELARAYEDLGEKQRAKDVWERLAREGDSSERRQRAREELGRLNAAEEPAGGD